MTQRSCPYRRNWNSGFRLLKIINLKKVRFLPLKKHQLELVVWTKDNFSGSYSPNFFRLSFLFSGFFKFFCRTYLLTRYDLFPTFLRILLEKYTIFFAISHLYWKFSNREGEKKMQKKVHHSVAASSCEKTKTKFYNYCIMHCVTFFVRLSFLDKSIKLNQ